MVYFQMSREKVMVEPGTAIRVSVRFGLLFYMRLAPHDISLAGIELTCTLGIHPVPT